MPQASTDHPPQQAAAVQQQLERMLVSSHFKQSKRCAALLRFVVESALRGETEPLRERFIGHMVFQRAANYDSSSDPIVRMSAAEVRKKIAQYYQDSLSQDEIRILLPSGGYVPTFIFPSTSVDGTALATVHAVASHSEAVAEAPSVAEHHSVAPPDDHAHPGHRRLWMTAAALLILILAAFGYWRFHLAGSRPQSNVEAVWKPMLASTNTVNICLGELGPGIVSKFKQAREQGDVSEMVTDFWTREAVSISDVKGASNITHVLDQRGTPYRIQLSSEVNYTALREGPIVLVGAMNNQWTIKMLENKRFQFTTGELTWVVDTKQPARRWGVDVGRATKLSSIPMDYAIAARFFDADTGQPIVIAAGIGGSGTRAAAEFLTSDASLQQLNSIAPGDWSKRSFEVVLKTQVFNTAPGAATIVDAAFW